jgi:hypothetical protein
MSPPKTRKTVVAKRSVSESFSPEVKLRGKRLNMAGKSVDADVLTSLNTVIASLESLEDKVSELSSTVATLKKELSDLCTDLRGEINALRVDFDERVRQIQTSQKKHLSSNERERKRMQIGRDVVICGVPIGQQENVCNIFKRICTQLEYTDVPVVAVSKFRAKKEDNKQQRDDVTPPIFVEFSLMSDKRKFMYQYFKKSADLNLSCLGMDNQSRIYVNDRLTKEDMDIKVKALKLKKDGKLHSVTVKDGRVCVKQSESTQLMALDDVEQLRDFP